MEIVINEEQIRNIMTGLTETTVRKRIKEMQGDYTSKGYLEEIIREVVWDKICNLIPNIDDYIESTVKESIQIVLEDKKGKKIPKSELVRLVVNGLLEELIDGDYQLV